MIFLRDDFSFIFFKLFDRRRVWHYLSRRVRKVKFSQYQLVRRKVHGVVVRAAVRVYESPPRRRVLARKQSLSAAGVVERNDWIIPGISSSERRENFPFRSSRYDRGISLSLSISFSSIK